MAEKLSWEEIKTRYDRQWIELVDFDWPKGTPNPVSGVVNIHASDRKEFHQLMKEREPKPTKSAFVFVGAFEDEDDTVLISPFMNP